MACCHCYIALMTTSILVAVFLLAFVSQVDSTATLELLMVRFDNPSGKKKDGNRCDPEMFGGDCDHIFRFALDLGDSDNNTKGYSYTKPITTKAFRDDNVNEFGNMALVWNPIVHVFDAWPSIGVKFKVVVTDEDIQYDDDVDGFVQLLLLTPALNASMANWTNITMLGTRSVDKTRLAIRYKLYCDANYYSSDCSVYCVANDTDAGGHYTCDPLTGSIICREGWEDESTKCITPSNDCLNHACLNGATCVDGVQTYTCLCLPGYTGANCEANVNECASNPCQHGGTCEDQVNGFACHCLPRFTGALCSDVYQTTTDIPPLGVITPDNEGNSSLTWLYVLIGVVCLVLLGLIAVIIVFCIRRRKAAKVSENQLATTLPPSLSETAAAAAASFCCSDDVGNVYATIDDAPTTFQATSLRPALLPPSAADAAAAKASFSVDADSVYLHPTTSSDDNVPTSKPSSSSWASQPITPDAAAATAGYCDMRPVCRNNVGNAYDTIDDAPTTSQSLTVSVRPTVPPPSSADAAAAQASVSVDANSVYLHPVSNSNDNVTTTSQPLSTSSLPPDIYVQASKPTDNVPCVYEMETRNKPNEVVYELEARTEPNEVAYANCLQELNVAESAI